MNLISIIAHTEMTIGILRVEGYFDRLAYALETFSK